METITCKICGNVGQSARDKYGNSGKYGYCVECHRAYYRVKTREWANKHKNDPEYIRKQKERNKYANMSERRKEGKRAANRRYHSRNSDKVNNRVKQWHRDNPDKSSALSIKHSAKRRQLIDASDNLLTSADIERRIRLFDRKCAYCGDPYKHIDHVIPFALGGIHTASNLVPACQRCNLSKTDKHWITWYQSRKFYSVERMELIMCTMQMQMG